MAGWPRRRAAVPVALAVLAEATPDIPGFDEMPKDRPKQFYVVSSVGGGMNLKYSSPRILVECWADDSAVAEEMAGDASQAFHKAKGQYFGAALIHGWDNEQGPVDFNDPDITDRRRSQLFGDLLISNE